MLKIWPCFVVLRQKPSFLSSSSCVVSSLYSKKDLQYIIHILCFRGGYATTRLPPGNGTQRTQKWRSSMLRLQSCRRLRLWHLQEQARTPFCIRSPAHRNSAFLFACSQEFCFSTKICLLSTFNFIFPNPPIVIKRRVSEGINGVLRLELWIRFVPVTWCLTGGNLEFSYSRGTRPTVDAEKDQLLCGSTGTSSGSCQERETHKVRACHVPRQFLQSHSWRHLGGSATPWLAEELLDGQRQSMDSLTHARTAHNGFLQKRLEEDLCWIVTRYPWRPFRSRHWTELNWTVMPWYDCRGWMVQAKY